jgi:hypothetical protein
MFESSNFMVRLSNSSAVGDGPSKNSTSLALHFEFANITSTTRASSVDLVQQQQVPHFNDFLT